MKSLIISIIMFMSPMFVFASMVNVKITGVIKNFDDKMVTLVQDGKTIELPRHFFDKKTLKVGNTVSSKELSPSDIKSIK